MAGVAGARYTASEWDEVSIVRGRDSGLRGKKGFGFVEL